MLSPSSFCNPQPAQTITLMFPLSTPCPPLSSFPGFGYVPSQPPWLWHRQAFRLTHMMTNCGALPYHPATPYHVILWYLAILPQRIFTTSPHPTSLYHTLPNLALVLQVFQELLERLLSYEGIKSIFDTSWDPLRSQTPWVS